MVPIAEVGSAFVSIMPSAKGFGSKLNSQVGGEVDKSGKTIGSRLGTAVKIGAVAALGGAALLGGFLKSAVAEASNAQQSMGATESIFKRFSQTVIGTSKAAAQQYGLSANQYRESANLLGSLFKNQGVEMDQLAGKTDTMIGRAADLSAMFGGTTAEAVESLGSAFKGEFNPLEKYGITLNQSAINAELAARGHDKLEGSAAAAAKQAATMDLIMRQSKDSMGTFADEAGTLAGQQQRLGAVFANLRSTVGTAFLPVATAGVSMLNNLFMQLAPAAARVAPLIARVRDALQGMFEGGNGAAGLASSLSGAFDAIRGAVAGMVSAFAPFIAAVLPSLIAAGAKIAAAFLPAVQSVAKTISSQLIPAFQNILPILAPIVSFLVGVFAGAVVGAIQGVAQAIRGIVTVIAGVFNLIAAIVTGDWAAVWGSLKQIVVGAVSGIIGVIKAWLNIGILGIFRQGAKLIAQGWRGMWTGLQKVASNVFNAIRNLVARAITGIGKSIVNGVRAYVRFWISLFRSMTQIAANGWKVLRSAFGGALAAIRTVVSQAMSRVRATFAAAWTVIRTVAVSAFKRIVDAVKAGAANVVKFVKEIPDRARSALSNLGSVLFNAGASLIQGLINGVESKISSLKSKLSSLTNLIPKLKGPPRTDAKLLYNNGQLIMGGLIRGIEDGKSGVRDSLSSLTAEIGGMKIAGPRINTAGVGGYGGAEAAAGGINFNGPITTVDVDELARKVDRKRRDAMAMMAVPA